MASGILLASSLEIEKAIEMERTEREKLETNTGKLKKKVEILKALRHAAASR